MSPHDFDRLQQLFGAASELPESERSAFLDAQEGLSSDTREWVEGQLAMLERSDSELLPKIQEAAAGASERSLPTQGQILDRYRLLEAIGEGGFGTVWMAEQLEPVRRKVAVKVIKAGMDTRQVVARFEAERQALALMEHPNIAKVLDGGSTDEGRPYFVMELVKGVPITEYCDEARSSMKERLQLFRMVCQAVQHAHQKGVIHRDLKPSNVLVTLEDGAPVPKVIDFGIAKATSSELTRRTLFTQFHQVLGTPEYMSPEQAALSNVDIDTRADVYSLGVLLYELLTGSTPFDLETALAAGYDEMLRVIREAEPPTPSMRVTTGGEAAAQLAGRRRTAPRQLSRLMRGDLDWIVMKSLEKQRDRRYATPAAFAEDIRRYLDEEPVDASPPTRRYKLRKFARRNRLALLVAGTVVAALVVGLALATWGFLEARTQWNAAEIARQEAEEERKAALTARDELEMRGFESRLALAMMVYSDGRYAEAEASLNELLSAVRSSLPPGDVILGDVLRNLAQVQWGFAKQLAEGGEPEAAEVRYRQAIATSVASLACAPLPVLERKVAEWRAERRGGLWSISDSEGQPLTRREYDRVAHADILRMLALHVLETKPAESVALLREGLHTYREVHGLINPGTEHLTLHLGVALKADGRGEEAEELLESFLAGLRRSDSEDHPCTAGAFVALARSRLEQGDTVTAERVAREGIERCVRPDVADGESLDGLMAVLLTIQGRRSNQEKVAFFRWALALLEEEGGSARENLEATCWHVLAATLEALGDLEGAVEAIDPAIAHWEQSTAQELRELLPSALRQKERWLYELKSHVKALEPSRRVLEVLEREMARAPASERAGFAKQVRQARRNLATTYVWAGREHEDAGRAEDWEHCSREAIRLLRILPDLSQEERRRLAYSLVRLGKNLEQQERYTEAEEVLRECIALRRQVLPDQFRYYNSCSRLAGVLLRLAADDPALVETVRLEAAALLSSAHAGMRKTFPGSVQGGERVSYLEALQRCVDNLLELRARTGSGDDLEALQEEAAQLRGEIDESRREGG